MKLILLFAFIHALVSCSHQDTIKIPDNKYPSPYLAPETPGYKNTTNVPGSNSNATPCDQPLTYPGDAIGAHVMGDLTGKDYCKKTYTNTIHRTFRCRVKDGYLMSIPMRLTLAPKIEALDTSQQAV